MTTGKNTSARAEKGFVSEGADIELLHRPEGFSGAISMPLLPDLLQIYTISLADGALTIRRDRERGTIWFDHGEIVHAECGGIAGEEAVYRLLQWRAGQFSLDREARAPVRSITASWQNVLMEGCRRLDEDGDAAREEHFEDALRRLDEALGGFRAAAIFDAGGSMLGQRSRVPGLDLRPSGPLLVEMLSAHPAPLLDCFWILEDQEHLIVPLPGGRMIQLLLDRDEVNLAVVRRTVERVCGPLA